MRKLMKLSLLPVLAASLILAGCSDQMAPSGELFGPQEAQFSQGGGKGLSRFKKVLGSVPDQTVLVDSVTVGASGGSLSAAGYELLIPGGAVKGKTKFKMEAMTDGSIGVKLTATSIDKRGRETDVGSRGFRKPVTLSLYYGWASDQIPDEAGLTIAWLLPNGQLVEQKSFVSTQYKRVFTDLQHFSDYILVMP
jgi:hypothetical protein